jgi:hypothetical protein
MYTFTIYWPYPGENEFMNLLNSMNRSWTFMKWFIKVHHSSSSLVHERFMNWNSLKFMNFWWTVYWFIKVHELLMNCLLVHECFLLSSWTVHVVRLLVHELWWKLVHDIHELLMLVHEYQVLHFMNQHLTSWTVHEYIFSPRSSW